MTEEKCGTCKHYDFLGEIPAEDVGSDVTGMSSGIGFCMWADSAHDVIPPWLVQVVKRIPSECLNPEHAGGYDHCPAWEEAEADD